MSGSRKGRSLSADDHALWGAVTRSITPLKRRRAVGPPAPNVAANHGSAESAAPKPQPKPAVLLRAVKPVAPALPLAPLGRRTKQKLVRGTEEIDARIDLHGRTQSEAHAALKGFLRDAQANGARFVLVITGKGARAGASDASSERGVLRRQVPMWLRLPEFRQYVVSFEDAHIGHGGEGALYVRVRRARG